MSYAQMLCGVEDPTLSAPFEENDIQIEGPDLAQWDTRREAHVQSTFVDSPNSCSTDMGEDTEFYRVLDSPAWAFPSGSEAGTRKATQVFDGDTVINCFEDDTDLSAVASDGDKTAKIDLREPDTPDDHEMTAQQADAAEGSNMHFDTQSITTVFPATSEASVRTALSTGYGPRGDQPKTWLVERDSKRKEFILKSSWSKDKRFTRIPFGPSSRVVAASKFRSFGPDLKSREAYAEEAGIALDDVYGLCRSAKCVKKLHLCSGKILRRSKNQDSCDHPGGRRVGAGKLRFPKGSVPWATPNGNGLTLRCSNTDCEETRCVSKIGPRMKTTGTSELPMALAIPPGCADAISKQSKNAGVPIPLSSIAGYCEQPNCRSKTSNAEGHLVRHYDTLEKRCGYSEWWACGREGFKAPKTSTTDG